MSFFFLALRGCVSLCSLSFSVFFGRINASFLKKQTKKPRYLLYSTFYLFSCCSQVRMRYSSTFINLLLASKGALRQKLKKKTKTNGTGLHAVALLCPHIQSRVSGTQNSHEKHASVIDGARLARPKRSGGSQLAPSAGEKKKKTNSASLWKDFSFDLTEVCKWLRGWSCTCLPPKSSETKSSLNPTL